MSVEVKSNTLMSVEVKSNTLMSVEVKSNTLMLGFFSIFLLPPFITFTANKSKPGWYISHALIISVSTF